MMAFLIGLSLFSYFFQVFLPDKERRAVSEITHCQSWHYVWQRMNFVTIQSVIWVLFVYCFLNNMCSDILLFWSTVCNILCSRKVDILRCSEWNRMWTQQKPRSPQQHNVSNDNCQFHCIKMSEWPYRSITSQIVVIIDLFSHYIYLAELWFMIIGHLDTK